MKDLGDTKKITDVDKYNWFRGLAGIVAERLGIATVALENDGSV